MHKRPIKTLLRRAGLPVAPSSIAFSLILLVFSCSDGGGLGCYNPGTNRLPELAAYQAALSLGKSGLSTNGCLCVSEDGVTATYNLVLQSQPITNAVIEATPDAQLTLNGGTAPIVLTFTPQNWNVPQTVTVGAVNDTVVEGNHTGLITHSVLAGDGEIRSRGIPSLTATITDNDSATLVFSPTGGIAAVEGAGTGIRWLWPVRQRRT